MLKKLQQLLEELEARKSEAQRMDDACTKVGHFGIATCYKQRVDAYDFCIQELTQILSLQKVEN